MRSFLLALAFSSSLGSSPITCSDCSKITFEANKAFCCLSAADAPAASGFSEYFGAAFDLAVGPGDDDDGDPFKFADDAKYRDPSGGVCFATACDNFADAASTGGDPVTRFENRETRFWLATDVLTSVFKQLSYTIFYRAGPARATSDPRRRGDWVVEAEVRLGGTRPETIHIEMVDPDLLNSETAFPVLGANLTTIRLSVGDKQLVVGNHSLSAGAVSISVAPLGKSSRIGNGFVERVEIKGDGIHVRFTSAKAQKFFDEAKQVKALHLDCEFVKFNRTAARGPLPEMWGLQPLSTETVLLLVAPKIAAQVDGSIIKA